MWNRTKFPRDLEEQTSADCKLEVGELGLEVLTQWSRIYSTYSYLFGRVVMTEEEWSGALREASRLSTK